MRSHHRTNVDRTGPSSPPEPWPTRPPASDTSLRCRTTSPGFGRDAQAGGGISAGDAADPVADKSADGSVHEVAAPYLIDASGLGNFTANRESQREYYEAHRKIAIFGHFEGVDMPTGEESGDILIVRRENSWIWLIPLAANKTSVGLVIDAADFKALGKTPQQAFDDAVLTTPAVRKRFPAAELLEKLQVIADFSYKNERLVSPRVLRDSIGVRIRWAGSRSASRSFEPPLPRSRTR